MKLNSLNSLRYYKNRLHYLIFVQSVVNPNSKIVEFEQQWSNLIKEDNEYEAVKWNKKHFIFGQEFKKNKKN